MIFFPFNWEENKAWKNTKYSRHQYFTVKIKNVVLYETRHSTDESRRLHNMIEQKKKKGY